MFATNYYCLVAGLKEYSLDADTKGFDAKAIVGEILEGVAGVDADAVRLLYGYYDCENIASLRAGRSAHNPLGNFTREELEEEVKAPRRLPAPVARVLRAFADPEGVLDLPAGAHNFVLRDESKLKGMEDLFRAYGIKQLTRTGKIAMSRGAHDQ